MNAWHDFQRKVFLGVEIKGLDRLIFEEAAARFGRGGANPARAAGRSGLSPAAPGAGLRQRRVLAASSVMRGSGRQERAERFGRGQRGTCEALKRLKASRKKNFFSPGGAPPLQKKCLRTFFPNEFAAFYPDSHAGGASFREAPRGASKSSSHRRLKSWHVDGALHELKAMILGSAQARGMICRNSGAVDGSFATFERMRRRGWMLMQGESRSHSSYLRL